MMTADDLQIRVVPSGFVVRNDDTGESVAVDDTTAVRLGDDFFCTEAVRRLLILFTPVTRTLQ